MKKIYMFRHGETDGDGIDRLAGSHNRSLTETGKAQAKKLSAFFEKNPVEALFASDLNRTKETAEILSEDINLPVVPTAHLREINVGKAKGLTWEEAVEKFPEVTQDWHKRFEEENKMLKFPKGESYHEFKGRIFSFMRFLYKKRPETNIAISTHGGVMDAVLNVMKKTTNRRFKNCEILCLEYKNEKLHFIKRVEI